MDLMLEMDILRSSINNQQHVIVLKHSVPSETPNVHASYQRLQLKSSRVQCTSSKVFSSTNLVSC